MMGSSFSFSDFVDFRPKDRQHIREIGKGNVCWKRIVRRLRRSKEFTLLNFWEDYHHSRRLGNYNEGCSPA
ncbi:unnamed protein product [Lactuca virosa]|uniref:Uncharacterized protein n=1 Tax=Lactuca virosa TaxID=75947 RepID=A0AAU9LU03_9ASTR|nr:unnamed protein product [Lactuca virosa]